METISLSAPGGVRSSNTSDNNTRAIRETTSNNTRNTSKTCAIQATASANQARTTREARAIQVIRAIRQCQQRWQRGGGVGGVLSYCLPQPFDPPLATHPFQDRALFPLLTETPPTFGRSVRFSHILHKNCSSYLVPVWSSVAIVYFSKRGSGVR